MKQKNIVLWVILSFVTFGICGIIWLINMTDDTNTLAHPEKPTSGLMTFILTLVTCGIYGWIWAYRMGGYLDIALAENGQPTRDRAVLYLVLQILGLGFVNYILMQMDLNSMLPEA